MIILCQFVVYFIPLLPVKRPGLEPPPLRNVSWKPSPLCHRRGSFYLFKKNKIVHSQTIQSFAPFDPSLFFKIIAITMKHSYYMKTSMKGAFLAVDWGPFTLVQIPQETNPLSYRDRKIHFAVLTQSNAESTESTSLNDL